MKYSGKGVKGRIKGEVWEMLKNGGEYKEVNEKKNEEVEDHDGGVL